MIFPPYIAQPCNLHCCRPKSVSNYCKDMQSTSLHLTTERCPTPPRPPPVDFYPERLQQKHLLTYKMIPIMKPAASMPQFTLANDNSMKNNSNYYTNETSERPTHNAKYRGSQPNLTSLRHDSKKMYTSNLTNEQNLDRIQIEKSQLPCAQFVKNVPRTSCEQRSTPYYYHELMRQRNSIFDSNLNLLQKLQTDDDNNPHSLGAISTRSEPIANCNGSTYLNENVPKPQPRLLSKCSIKLGIPQQSNSIMNQNDCKSFVASGALVDKSNNCSSAKNLISMPDSSYNNVYCANPYYTNVALSSLSNSQDHAFSTTSSNIVPKHHFMQTSYKIDIPNESTA